ncbi:MAG: MTH938/NDUFAF3 family protein [Anaerolineales bacterium]
MIPPKIDSYRFGRIVIDGQAYSRDVIILPDRVIRDWWRGSGHILHPDDLLLVFEASPEVLVVGQGSVSRMQVLDETKQALEEAGIELISLPTKEACQKYNEVRTQYDAAAALHLTC